MRIQNILACVVFGILLACSLCMQLLQWYPASSTLWYLNITYAREARPVLELLDCLPFDGLIQNMLVIFAMIGLCGLAVRRRSLMLTAATTHAAAYVAIFAVVASSFRTFGTLQAASASATNIGTYTEVLAPSQVALGVILVVMLITCLFNHYQIASDLLRRKLDLP